MRPASSPAGSPAASSRGASTGAADRPVQKFKPTTGQATGWLGLAACLLVVGVVVTSEQHLTGLRVALGAVLVAVLIWVTLLRPRATAYDDALVLRGMVSDTTLPLARIDTAVVRHMLVVRVGQDRYTCSAIARSSRSMRARGPGAPSGLGVPAHHMGSAVGGSGGGTGGTAGSADYASFVESRIEDLARSARRDGKDGPAVQRRWARVEIAALAVAGLAFALSLWVL